MSYINQTPVPNHRFPPPTAKPTPIAKSKHNSKPHNTFLYLIWWSTSCIFSLEFPIFGLEFSISSLEFFFLDLFTASLSQATSSFILYKCSFSCTNVSFDIIRDTTIDFTLLQREFSTHSKWSHPPGESNILHLANLLRVFLMVMLVKTMHIFP